MDDFVVVKCVNESCGSYDNKQRVQNGVSLSPTVRLVGTLRCTLCGHDLMTVPE